MYYEPVKASCVASVINLNPYYQHTLISYSGGVFGSNRNLWLEEFDNLGSVDIKDIFSGFSMPPNKEGFYVWEGKATPVEYDQSEFDGVWRPATKEDMAALIQE